MVVIKHKAHPYWDWECFKNGMYRTSNSLELIEEATCILSNEQIFEQEDIKMINCWKISSEHYLTNHSINRRSWIGQATCCFSRNVPEVLTRIAWGRISELERLKANKIAEKLIKKYEEQNRNLYQSMETEGLL